MTATAQNPDLEAVKGKQQIAWSTGHYSRVGSTIQISGERLALAMDARPGATFLDVAAGNGNLTLAAARRFCRVTSTDYVASSLEDGRRRAEANGFEIDFRTADAEALPFEDGSFEFVGSTFGVMFTADQRAAAAELVRVCAPGGRIGMANWTPGSFIGQLFKTIGRFVPPPAGVQSPALWGTREFLDAHFGADASEIRAVSREYVFRYGSAEHFMQVFRGYYGPMIKAFEVLDETTRPQLERAIVELLQAHDVATDGTLAVPSEYLEIVITKRA